MKDKFVLLAAILTFTFSSGNVGGTKIDSDDPCNPYDCWDLANAVETLVCDEVGCGYGIWVIVYDGCQAQCMQ